MRFTVTAPVLVNLDDRFYCRSRRDQVTLEKCLDGYMEANAMERRRSACFRCPQGRRNRENFANNNEEG
jgi:hypothetical protein